MGTGWSKEEDKLLIEYSKIYNDIQMSNLIFNNRTPKSINHRRQKLGIKNIRSTKSSNRKWTPEEDDFVIDNYRKLTYAEMAEFLPGRTADAIEVRKTKLNPKLKNPILRKSSNNPWSDEEHRLIEESYGNLTYEEMALLLPGRTPLSVQSRRRVLGFDGDSNEIRRTIRKHDLNLSFFKKPNVVNSYIAGFIAADGNISKSKPTTNITIHQKDKEILETIKNLVGYSGDLVYKLCISSKSLHGSPMVSINFNSDLMVKDLKNNFNIVPKKSLILKPPNLTYETLIKSFIKGYLDGDGCIRKDDKGISERDSIWSISFCGTHEVLSWIKYYFDKWAPNAYHNIFAKIRKYDFSRIHYYSVSGKRAVEILKILCAVKTPYLKRKWEKFMNEHDCFYEFEIPSN